MNLSNLDRVAYNNMHIFQVSIATAFHNGSTYQPGKEIV